MRRRPPGSPAAPEAALRSYDRRRGVDHRSAVCHAPFNNLYFRADGAVAPCWLQFHDRSPHWLPDGPTVRELWHGEQLSQLRDRLRAHELVGACATCLDDIRVSNRPLAAAYDEIGVDDVWPTMFEVELSNQCNLECVMCSGMLSSRIRANREQLPPLEVPYDETFLVQLAEFLPHLDELRINGGEPLMQSLVFSLLDLVADTAPTLKVTIATNGTVFNDRVERALERCNIHLNVSIDSLVPERYEQIRVHGRHAVVMRNVERFLAYTRRAGTTLCVMVNPMRPNWDELGRYVRWCNERDAALWFNTIRYPESVALHSLPADELRRIRASLLDEDPIDADDQHWLHRRNLAVFERFRDVQLPAWIAAAEHDGPGDGQPVALRPRRGLRRAVR